jgi:hypothetical protein
MARISIYVTDDLKKRIDAAGDDTINWSEVARPALSAALAAFEHRKGKNMTTAVERLRASKQETEQDEKVQGTSDGRNWAENDAEYIWLRRLYEMDDRPEELIKELALAIDPSGEINLSEVVEKCFGEVSAKPSDEYVEAFIEGAVDFFKEVRTAVES